MAKKSDKVAIDFLKERMKDEDFRRHYFEEQMRITFGEEVARVRKKKKMSEQELGEAVGLGKDSVRKLEKGDWKRLTFKLLADIAAATGQKIEIRFVDP